MAIPLRDRVAAQSEHQAWAVDSSHISEAMIPPQPNSGHAIGCVQKCGIEDVPVVLIFLCLDDALCAGHTDVTMFGSIKKCVDRSKSSLHGENTDSHAENVDSFLTGRHCFCVLDRSRFHTAPAPREYGSGKDRNLVSWRILRPD